MKTSPWPKHKHGYMFNFMVVFFMKLDLFFTCILLSKHFCSLHFSPGCRCLQPLSLYLQYPTLQCSSDTSFSFQLKFHPKYNFCATYIFELLCPWIQFSSIREEVYLQNFWGKALILLTFYITNFILRIALN